LPEREVFMSFVGYFGYEMKMIISQLGLVYPTTQLKQRSSKNHFDKIESELK